MNLGQKLDHMWSRKFQAHQNRLKLKEKAIAFLGGKCSICGYDKCTAALEFHHTDMETKEFNISSKATWNPKFEKEILKTILLCSNCHKEVHAGWHPSMLTLE